MGKACDDLIMLKVVSNEKRNKPLTSDAVKSPMMILLMSEILRLEKKRIRVQGVIGIFAFKGLNYSPFWARIEPIISEDGETWQE